jgi:hypothetical protein
MESTRAFLAPVMVLVLTGSFLAAPQAAAALRGPTEHETAPLATCPGDAPTRAHLRDRLRAMAERYYLASLEAPEDPEQFLQVRQEIDWQLATLSRRYGKLCLTQLDESGIARRID